MKQKIRICPKCGSADIELKPTVIEAFGGAVPFTIKCNNCGYVSRLEIEKEIGYKKK